MCHTNRVKFTSKIHGEIHGKIHGPVNFRIRPQSWAHFRSSFACSGEGHFASDLEALGNNTRPGARFGGHLKITGDTCPHVFHFWRAKIHHHNFVRGGASDTCAYALEGCLRSGARCVSVNRGSFAFWPAAWGCSDSSDLIQVSTFFIAATQLNQVCLLLCSPVRPTAGSISIFYCRH